MRTWIVAIAAAVVFGSSCGGGSSSASHRCLSDGELCQFQVGVSTTADVRAALGNPQQSQVISSGNGTGLQQWLYVCQMSGQTVDAVQFVFDESGVLEFRQVIRSGPGVQPVPTCPN